jgi:hypothetical protein
MIKKTSETHGCHENATAENASLLRNEYEELRSYVLSPVKALPHPIGLDLWCKRGFRAWIGAISSRSYPETQAYRAPARQGNPAIPHELPISLANIIIEWRMANG